MFFSEGDQGHSKKNNWKKGDKKSEATAPLGLRNIAVVKRLA